MSMSTFQSSHLLYRTVEPLDEAFTDFELDGIGGLAAPDLLTPPSSAAAKKVFQTFSTALLGVMICLSEGNSRPSLVSNGQIHQGTPIGFLALYQRDAYPCVGTFAIGIAPKYQRQEYGREALNWSLDWGFREAQFHRIQLNTAG